MEHSKRPPVVHGSLVVDLGSCKNMMRTVCSDLRMEDSRMYTKCCAVLQRSRAMNNKTFFLCLKNACVNDVPT